VTRHGASHRLAGREEDHHVEEIPVQAHAKLAGMTAQPGVHRIVPLVHALVDEGLESMVAGDSVIL
jgi:hypothetical protein